MSFGVFARCGVCVQGSACWRQSRKWISRKCRETSEGSVQDTQNIDRGSTWFFIDAKSCLIAWIPRHSANLMTRFKQYSDGKTAIQRLTGRRWGRPMVVFGERILVKVAAPRAARRAGLESAFVPAVYVGHHGRSGALMALTDHGER